MKIVFSLEDKEKESVGTIIIEGDWQNHHFRNHVFRFLARMEPPDVNSSVETKNDSSNQSIIGDKDD